MIQMTLFGRDMSGTSAISNVLRLRYGTANYKHAASASQAYRLFWRAFFTRTGIHFARKRHQGVDGAQGSASAAPLAFTDTGASPITATSARSASLTPSPVAPDISSGVFLAARFSRSFCFFNSSG